MANRCEFLPVYTEVSYSAFDFLFYPLILYAFGRAALVVVSKRAMIKGYATSFHLAAHKPLYLSFGHLSYRKYIIAIVIKNTDSR